MHKRTEKFGAQRPFLALASGVHRGLFRKRFTHLAEIAVVLQQAPGKMLTFTRLMDKLETFSEDRKSAENNIRVCLSTNKCFVKVPLIPGSMDCKRNYWKFDPSQITAKMVRRHFKGILELFPELASRLEAEKRSGGPQQSSAHRPPEAVRIRCGMKFIGPFSIDSLLRRDSPSALASTASPPSSVLQPRPACRGAATNRSFSWEPPPEPLLPQDSAAASGSYTHYGFAAGGAAKPIKMLHVCAEPSLLAYTTAFPAFYFISSHSSYITHPVPTFTHDAHHFRL